MEYLPKLAVLLIALSSAMIVTGQNTAQDVVDTHNAARTLVGVGQPRINLKNSASQEQKDAPTIGGEGERRRRKAKWMLF